MKLLQIRSSKHPICKFHPDDMTYPTNSRRSSSATLLSWWLELNHISSEFEIVSFTILVLLGLFDLPFFLREFLQILLVFLISFHLGFVLLSVLLNELLLCPLLFTHVFHL